MRKSVAISYAVFFVVLICLKWLHLAPPLLAVLFACLALDKLNFLKRKWLAVLLFLILVAGIFCGFVFFLKTAMKAMPEIVSTSIPGVVKYAQDRGIELPFTDIESLKKLVLDSVDDMLGYMGNFAKIATKEFVFLVGGVVIAVGLFINPEIERDRKKRPGKRNLYAVLTGEITGRFRSFFQSFETVIGAQLLISLINTIFTSIFVVISSLPYPGLVIIVTFLCGLLPIIGNIISNTIIVGIAFTISPKMALAALIFLITIHKLEYFLNSKIIGTRIQHPMWLTLLALIIGERLMGISGIILAPVVLHFIRIEMSKYEVGEGGRIREVSQQE